MTCGEKITAIRKENNLTQEQFAEMLNVSRQSVSKWELGTTFPDTEKLIKISKMFSCSLDYLLKEEIENKDTNQLQESDNAKKNYFLGLMYTYLSFAPIFGFIVGIYNIYHQKQTVNNRKMITLSILGIIVSLIFTVLMVMGIVFEM
ncbi:MAG: helix-turn-helix domain-containing protein [Oscillospiraceae bacterium]